jgi:hypothetical protein
MLTGFFNLYKPREYKFRHIYYDPKKEAAKERERKLAEESNGGGEYQPTIRRGSFREQADRLKSSRSTQSRQSNVRLIIILVFLFAIAYFLIR